nr:hypothetical protein [Tanacetum cinerariifolium]
MRSERRYWLVSKNFVDEELDRAKLFRRRQHLNPPLEISKERFEDPNKEKDRNRFPLSTLLQQNPGSYRSVRFTCEATITTINTSRDWCFG